MKESIIYQTSSLYRDDFRVKAYTFGSGEKSLCVVGSVRGNEYQQIFLASQFVQRMKRLEAEGRLVEGKQVMVIPTLNPSSINIGKRFWAIDNTDINRMFPGYDQGETTQRIAAGVFEVVNKYSNGIQFSSFYMPGSFLPNVRLTHTGFENLEKAADFGLPYVVVRDPHPYDTTTLNYNWQIWETDAYSLYSSTTKRIDPVSAKLVLDAAERFMIKNGIIRGTTSQADPPRIFMDTELIPIRTKTAGLIHLTVQTGDIVKKGDVCAEVYNTSTGEMIEILTSPADGLVFFLQDEPLVYCCTAAVKILPELPSEE